MTFTACRPLPGANNRLQTDSSHWAAAAEACNHTFQAWLHPSLPMFMLSSGSGLPTLNSRAVPAGSDTLVVHLWPSPQVMRRPMSSFQAPAEWMQPRYGLVRDTFRLSNKAQQLQLQTEH